MPTDASAPATPPLLVDRREAARLLGVSPGTVDNLRARGELPSLKLAARRLYDVADLRRFIERVKAAEAPGTAPGASRDADGPEGGTR